MKLIDNWKRIWRFYSMHALAVAAAIPAAWEAVPADWKSGLPAWTPAVMGAVVFIAGAIGRVVQQAPADQSGGQ